ncbi:UDP-glucose 4-epimerase GalE [Phytohabitans flavus]|uniref:UDP-glucose 4-epimerase n=2 Tax=Phytohabitans flavus TaxID=1076124 RepID=A0A6F8Y4Q9_9ACTN|nr:UDP-glucose 4-epimerase GalE [Phytohabitans flavus]BCB80968.1 UDP-glucose 4-epimerase GalE [Phytohabitans flavus]
MTWLVTGGAGYIGGRVVEHLHRAGYEVVVFDDLSTGLRERIPPGVSFAYGALTDYRAVQALFRQYPIRGVVHLAARKSVGESVLRPQWYWRENVDGLSILLNVMNQSGVRHLLFASSAAVYGDPASSPVNELMKTMPINPYGKTKLVGESLIRAAGDRHGLSWLVLRHFNVAGSVGPRFADRSRTSLLTNIFRAATGGPVLAVLGTQYPTPDGTAIRDYVHVDDVASAYAKAVDLFSKQPSRWPGGEILNVGRGTGTSVREVIAEVERVIGRVVPRREMPNRPGDPAAVVADPQNAMDRLVWKPESELAEMVESAWQAWCALSSGRPRQVSGSLRRTKIAMSSRGPSAEKPMVAARSLAATMSAE